MSEPKWTPGPWRWWTSNSWRRLSSDHHDYDRDGGVLCPTTSRSDGHPDCIVKDADMALIAVAPELAAFVEKVRAVIAPSLGRAGDDYLNEGGGHEAIEALVEEAASLLAKARGET